jgi:hypothetical protein
MKITLKHITCIVLAATTFALVGCTTGSRYGRSTGQYIDDKTVTANMKRALARDSLTDGTMIEVQTFRGNVHLTGFVQHPIQKQQASQLARRVDGVQYFKNDIIVKSELPNMRAMQGSTISEPAGAQSGESQQMHDSAQENGTSSGWQRGSYNEFGPRREFNEPSGAEVDVEKERSGTEIDADKKRGAEVDVDADIERNQQQRGPGID